MSWSRCAWEFPSDSSVRRRPVETGDGEIMQFLKDHPNAKIVSYHDRIKKDRAPEYVQIFRNRLIAVWDGAAVLLDPEVAKRNAPP